MIHEKKKRNLEEDQGQRGRGRGGRGRGERGRGRGGKGGGHREEGEKPLADNSTPEEKLMAILGHLSDFIKMKLDSK